MKVFYHDQHHLHSPEWYLADGAVRPAPDLPARAEKILQAIQSANEHECIHITPAIQNLKFKIENFLPVLRAVHSPAYLRYLQTIHPLWFAEFHCDVLPDTFPRRLPGTKPPQKPAAQAGFYCFDMAAPITAGTWHTVLASAHCATAAADALKTDKSAYALCRPPGHHAGPDYCGGFCYLNNAAIAAQHLLNSGLKKVAILDVDYHHGNGTQDIFYRRRDVLFLSLHADPNTQYPYFWGHADETGEAEGTGFTANFPLPRGTTAPVWFAALDAALARLQSFHPDALLISLGVDTSQSDPVGDFQLTLPDFTQLGQTLAHLSLPTLIIQEGGYNLDTIGPCVEAVLKPFAA